MQTLKPNWPAPPSVKAHTTLRKGGISQAPYNELNLAQHVGDDSNFVITNRNHLKENLQLPNEPIWLEQTHSTIVIPALPENRGKNADASFTTEANAICAILTADCLPILLCNKQGTYVAAIHAGWRGLANGIIEQTLKLANIPFNDIMVWLGPGIGPAVYEVGDEVRELFINENSETIKAFTPSPNLRWLADIYALARIRFKKQNITEVYGGEYCTYSAPELFYSARRNGFQTGRMASLIWITDSRTTD